MRGLVSLLVVLGIVCIAYPDIGNIFASGPSIQKSEKGFLAVEQKNKYFELDIKGSLSLNNYRVIQWRKAHSSTRDFGALIEVAVVPNADYTEFQKITESGGCAASFLNTHAHNLLLVPGDDQTKKLLNSMRLGSGDGIPFSGKELAVAYAEINGKELSSFELRNITLVLIESIMPTMPSAMG